MNIVKMLEKQIGAGKTIVTADGNIISKDDIRKVAMKQYLAGVKDGSIPTNKSFEEYLNENGGNNATVEEIIDFIKNPTEAEE